MNDRVIQNNIFDEPIEECSCAPLTGFFRTGCCETSEQDTGTVSYTHLTLPTSDLV